LWPAVARYVEPRQLGTAYGLMTMLQSAGVMSANLAAGYLNDASGASAGNPAGYAAMLWFFGLTSLAGFVFTVLLRRSDARAAR
jgi:MFS family permease